MLRGMAKRLEPHLSTLEANHISNTPCYDYFTSEVSSALAKISRITGDGVCNRREASSMIGPGIEIVLAMGFSRTRSADPTIDRVSTWLESGKSVNLLCSLRGAPLGTRRHAVLVLDPSFEPEYQSSVEMRGAFLPTRPIELPVDIDELWIIIGPMTLRYVQGLGWQSWETAE